MIELNDFERYYDELKIFGHEIGFTVVGFGWFSIALNSTASQKDEDQLRWLIRHETPKGMETLNG